MDQARAIIDEYEAARRQNVDEWNGYAADLQQRIQAHNARLCELQQAEEALAKEQTALLDRRGQYEARFTEFEAQAEALVKMDQKQIAEQVKAEAARLSGRRAEVEAAAAKMEEEFQRIEAEKGRLMEEGQRIQAEEAAIAQEGQAIQAEGGALQEMQTKLQQLVAQAQDESTAAAARQDIAKQAQALQTEFNEKVTAFQPRQAAYKATIDAHNGGRRTLHESMQVVDREMQYFNERADIHRAQVAEVNEQITRLNEKMSKFSTAANYVAETRAELEAWQGQLNADIAALAGKGEAHTAACAELSAEADALNGQIANKDLQLKSFKDQDRTLVEEGGAKLQALREQAMAAGAGQ